MTTPATLPGGQVTLADLFRVMSQIQADLGKITTRLEVNDALSKTTGQHVDTMLTDHENRIRSFEAFRFRAAGAATLLGTAAGILGSWGFTALHH